ncbi:MAG: PEGA domain-containing protein [Nitrosomonadales bacterium]|nr:PEGA domain-containing protein [Nitrosomonadales bacterium]
MKRSSKTISLFGLLLVAGCTSTGGIGSLFPQAGVNPIKIESNPSGAEVYVMGEKIGVTPIDISTKKVFPNIYPVEKQSMYGRITLKKAGCTDFTRTISSEISNNGLRAQLDCSDSKQVSAKTSDETPRSSATVEQRLDKIKELLNRGLITEEEAQKAREHILHDL